VKDARDLADPKDDQLDLLPDLEEKGKKSCCHPAKRYSSESSSDAITAV